MRKRLVGFHLIQKNLNRHDTEAITRGDKNIFKALIYLYENLIYINKKHSSKIYLTMEMFLMTLIPTRWLASGHCLLDV